MDSTAKSEFDLRRMRRIIFLALTAVIFCFPNMATAERGEIRILALGIENPRESFIFDVIVRNPFLVSRSEWTRIEAYALERGYDVYYNIPDGFDAFMNCPRYGSTDFMPCRPYDGEIFYNCYRSRTVETRGLNDRDFQIAMYEVYRRCHEIALDPSIIDRLRY